MPKPKPNKSCPSCKKRIAPAQRVPGMGCPVCNAYYCTIHRMPEAHGCDLAVLRAKLRARDVAAAEEESKSNHCATGNRGGGGVC